MNTAVILNIIAQLIGGAAGGNGLGKLLQQFSLGTLGNSVAGAVGGLAGGSWLGPLIASGVGAAASGGLDLGALAGNLVGGGVGGAVLTLIIGVVRKMLAGNKA